MAKLHDHELLSGWFELWTADGYLWRADGTGVPCEDARTWYPDERRASEWVDLGGSD